MPWYDVLLPSVLRIIAAAIALLEGRLRDRVSDDDDTDTEESALRDLESALRRLQASRKRRPTKTPPILLDLDGDGIPETL